MLRESVSLLVDILPNCSIDIRKVPSYNDEPKIFQYVAELRNTHQSVGTIRGYGSDLLNKSAAHKAVCEALERACLNINEDIPTIKRSISHISSQFVDPYIFKSFTDDQLSSEVFRRMRISKTSELSWTLGTNAFTGQDTWLPSQLVFCPFDLSEEPVIRFPSSNGTALGASEVEARCRAVLEIIERDAFMCWYLAAKPASLLNPEILNKHEDLKKLLIIYQRYHLDLTLLVLPSLWSFPVVLALIIDHTGFGPGLCIGMKCHPHLVTAIRSAIFEAQQMRPWLRDHMYLHGLPDSFRKSEIKDAWSRALYWARPNQHQEISFLWETANDDKLVDDSAYTLDDVPVNWDAVWDEFLLDMRGNQMDLFLVDLTYHSLKEQNINVIKALIPQAHPVYMDERFPYLTSQSLNHVLASFGPRWNLEKKGCSDFSFPPHPFS